MNVFLESRSLVRCLNFGTSNCQPRRIASFNGSHLRCFSELVAQNLSLQPRGFYQIPPLRHMDVLVAKKNKEAFSHFDADKEAFFEGRYSHSNNFMRSWQCRSLNPDIMWTTLTGNAESAKETIHSLLSASEEINATNCEEILEKRGGVALMHLSYEDLIKIWGYFKEKNECDKMIELFHCRRASRFTASPAILLDYCFAHLKSSYCHPVLIGNIAKRLLEKQNLPRLHYVLGLSHMRRAHVAKKFGDLIAQGKVAQGKDNLDLVLRYRECFGGVTFQESALKYQESLRLAEVDLREALNQEFNGPYALALILNLIEQEHLTQANEISEYAWLRLNQQASLTTQDAQTLVIAGLISGRPRTVLEEIAHKMLIEEPGLKTEYMENLSVLASRFQDAQEVAWYHLRASSK